MVLGFKKQFVQPILNGEKIHTIREDVHNRWAKDRKIHFAVGVRTKNYNQFKEGCCYSVQQIEITYRISPNKRVPEIFIDGARMSCMDDHWQLAKNDGFEESKDFKNGSIRTLLEKLFTGLI